MGVKPAQSVGQTKWVSWV